MPKSISLGFLSQIIRSKRDSSARVALASLLLPFLLFVVGGQIATAPSANAVYSNCTPANATAVPQKTTIGSNFELTPSHGQNFYVDFSKTPNLNASYIGYRVKNVSGVVQNNVWVKLSGFSSGTAANNLLSLANAADYKMQIPTIAAGEEKTVYFLIAASRASILTGGSKDATTTQTHVVEIFNGDPDAQTPSIAGGCNFIFKEVTDVIEAAANKVTSVSVSNATPTLGELVTVTAVGTPGTVGAGDSGTIGDRDIVWLSPSAIKTFPTRALRLESVSINYTSVNAGCQVEYSEQLLMTGMSACVQNVPYTATYKFRVIGSSTSTVTLAPIANIASGTQIKHTDASSATATINLANVATTSKFTISKTVSIADSETVSPNVLVPYTIKVTNTGLTDLTLDYVLDDPSAGTYVDDSGSYIITNKSSAGSSVPINPSLRTDSNYYFVGPFTIPAASTDNGTDSYITIRYKMRLALASSGTTTTYTNSASGFVGSQRVSSASSITLTMSDAGAQGVTVAPTATTNSATSVGATSATLNGSFTTGNNTNVDVKFVYGTSSSAVTAATFATTTSTTEVATGSSSSDSDTSTVLSGLTTGTTYFFRILIKRTSDTQYASGEVLSFQTGVPTATTTAATSIATTSATINGTVGTGGDSDSKYYFIYGTDPDLAGATSSTETVIPGSSVSLNWTGLTASTTYYFRVVAKNSTGTITVSGDILNFTTSATPSIAPVVPPVIITWPTPTQIQYPTPLSGTQLNASALCNGQAVTGTYTYTPALGTILAPGIYTLIVTFVPTVDTCQSASTTVRLVVTAPPAPTIIWPNPNSVIGPHTLSPTQLNAVCSVPGVLTYNPPVGTILQPGTYTLSVTCTPTDRNYPPVSTTVILVVEKQYPKISWNDPLPIIIGTPLTGTQLNALFSVPGNCVYTPALNTVLPVGIHTLSVTCTPTNGNLYYPLSTTVKIEVLPLDKSTVDPIEIPGGAPSTLPVPKELQGSRSQILTIGPCLTSATISGARITYSPGPGCSGKTYITLSNIINGKTNITTIPITILVVAPPSKTGPITFTEGKIWWSKSPNAKSYEVTIWGTSVCSTTELSCNVTRTIGPKTPVVVIAKGNDGLTASSNAVYENKKPLVVTSVYFDTAKFIIKPEGNTEIIRVAKIIKKEGFTRLIIEGHTDTKGGIDNQTLSNNRSKVTAAAFKKLLPSVSSKISGSAFKKPAATNDTPEGMALNRRSEVLVW